MPKSSRDRQRRNRIPVESRNRPPVVAPGAEWPKHLSLPEAAARVDMTVPTLRNAIRTGKLRAFIPGGRTPGTAGSRSGYRIVVTDLEAWYFNHPVEP